MILVFILIILLLCNLVPFVTFWWIYRVNSNKRELFLAAEEERLKHIKIVSGKWIPESYANMDSVMVCNECVLGSNYAVRIISKLVNFFGGEDWIYTRLFSQSRRLATVRLLNQVASMNGTAVANIKIDSVMMRRYDNDSKELLPFGISVLVSATALIPKSEIK